MYADSIMRMLKDIRKTVHASAKLQPGSNAFTQFLDEVSCIVDWDTIEVRVDMMLTLEYTEQLFRSRTACSFQQKICGEALADQRLSLLHMCCTFDSGGRLW